MAVSKLETTLSFLLVDRFGRSGNSRVLSCFCVQLFSTLQHSEFPMRIHKEPYFDEIKSFRACFKSCLARLEAPTGHQIIARGGAKRTPGLRCQTRQALKGRKKKRL